jgi:hypothetical protein
MKLDRIIREISEREPQAAEIEHAAARVKARLFPHAGEASPEATGTIRSCADFTRLMPAFLAGALDPGRGLLVEVHIRECVACRRSLESARAGGRRVIEFSPRKAVTRGSVHTYAGWAIAAAALLVAGTGAWWGFEQYPALSGGPRATVDSVEGALYKVSGASLTPLAPGAELDERDSVRTGKNSRAIVRLNDGSRIELNQRAEIFVTRSWSGSTIHLGLGSIIVQAAKQRKGTLQVATADCNVSVKGTVFSVDAGTKGSRVAVAEGTVWVDHGGRHDVLGKGDVRATAGGMGQVPIRDEFAWSRNSAEYLALIGEFSELKRRIVEIPAPGLRYQSNLMGNLPAGVMAVAAIPNVGGTIAQASQIFHDRLKQSDTLAQWWNQVPAARRNGFETTIQRLTTAGAYLGNEIVIAVRPGYANDPSPIILAQTIQPGLDTFLQSQLPPEVFDGHMRFANGLFVAASNPKDLESVVPSGEFLHTPLYQRIAPAYRQGAGWLFGADLGRIPQLHGSPSGISDARFLVAESRTVGGNTENRASLTFTKERQGVASWLAAPGPMGSLDFVSPDAGFAATMLLKNPALIVDDIMSITSAGQSSMPDLKADMAGAFGGEVTVALDGPLLPAPSWKLAAEVYYPDRLQGSIAKLVTAFNGESGHEKTGDLELTQSQADGRAYYRLKFEKLPWEADWTFVDGYWLAAANHELLVRSMQNRQVGYSLPRSDAFRAQLPHDASADFSAVVYHNLGPTLGPLLKMDDKPGVICFWAAPDRIDVATMGSIFGMKIESLLAMQGSGPLKILQQALVPGGDGIRTQ